jgi:sugar-specific transcriptional regulator TrmB
MIKLNEKQREILINLGLSKAQIDLYLCSLKNGVLSVLELSKLTKINRQHIYSEAEKLVELGLYQPTRKQGKKYIAASPDRLKYIAEQQARSAQKALLDIDLLVPELQAVSTSKKNKVLFKYFEGQDKIKQAYEEELKIAANTEVLSFAGSLEHIFDFFPEKYWDKWNKKLRESKSTSKMLAHHSPTALTHSKHDRDYARETRFLHNFPLKVNIDIFNTTVLIVSFEEQTAIWIDSKVLSSSYRILFNTLWQQANKFI